MCVNVHTGITNCEKLAPAAETCNFQLQKGVNHGN